MNRSATTNRACEQCRRKKIRCDGARPICTLCERVRVNCSYPQRKPRTKRYSRSNGPGEGDAIVAKGSRSSNPQQPGAPTSESGDIITFMSGSESTREESNQPLSDSRSEAADEEVCYPGTPTSFVREPSNQYERTSPTDQEMVDYLTQAIPDIWTQEPATQLDPFADSMVVGETNFDFFSLDNMESQPAPNELPIFQDQESRPGNGQNQPNVAHTTSDNSESCLFDASSDIVDDLINLYFRRVQVFLPLFHKPTFHINYLSRLSTASRTNQDKESQFVVYGMMALSARFSTLSSFDGVGLKERGVPFSRKARMIYQEMIRGSEPHGPSLKWLQGCILLAYYNQSCQADTGCDLMAAICTRLAYSLGLHKVDDDPNPSPSREEWVCKEEQRRAWWSVWELDAFDSITSRRPFSIDKYRMCVHLPVSDEAWFSGTLVESANLNTDVLQCWKSLRDSENRDERAWFLISNFITVQALELCQQRHVPIKDITQVETVVSCFSLLFHERYGGSADQLLFDEQNYGKSNWLILTRLMIQGGHIATRMLSRRASSGQALTGSASSTDRACKSSVSESPPGASSVTASMSAAISSTSIEDYIQPATEAFRIYQSWPPEFIGFCPPPMVCIITGPAAIMLRFARHLRAVSDDERDASSPSIQEDLLILVLGKLARYWNIGLLLLDFVRAF